MNVLIVDVSSRQKMWIQLSAQLEHALSFWEPGSKINSFDLVLLNWDAEQTRIQFLQELEKESRVIPVVVLSQSLDAVTRTSEFINYTSYPLTAEQLKKCVDIWQDNQIVEVVHWQRLKRFDEHGQLLKEIIEAIPRTGEKYLEALEKAVLTHDCLAIERQAHGLKSSMSYIGASRLIAVCLQLENYSYTTSQAGLQRSLLLAKQEFINLSRRLHELSQAEM